MNQMHIEAWVSKAGEETLFPKKSELEDTDMAYWGDGGEPIYHVVQDREDTQENRDKLRNIANALS